METTILIQGKDLSNLNVISTDTFQLPHAWLLAKPIALSSKPELLGWLPLQPVLSTE